MAIRITEDGVVNYENSPDVNRKLFPNLNVCGKEIDKLEEEINGKAPAVFSTATGSIASFDNGADDMPLKSCVVSFGPIQEGEGDPSPENVRPISGRTVVSVARTGKNLLGGLPLGEAIVNTVNRPQSAYFGEDEAGKFVAVTAGTAITNKNFTSTVKFKENTRYTIILKATKKMDGQTASNIQVRYTDGSATSITINDSSTTVPTTVFTSAINKTIKNLETAYYSGITYIYYENCGIFEGVATEADYEPYKGSTYSVNWETEAGTVYGGYVDVVSGKLVVDRANIASYNGETLTSTWISDRDVYAEGTAPTTGAQVVYKLAEPIEYQLAPQEIRTLLGENNIWSVAGDVSVDYPADTKTYIDDLSIKTVEVSGQTPTITAEENTRYICGEVTSLNFTPSEKGICDVRFTAASISTVLTLPETVKLPDWFDPTLLESGTTYEINIVDGVYGVVMSWA